jgi:pilus assembly protein Flp/PilA
MLSQFWLWLRTFAAQEEEGQTLIEYGLILVLIAIVVIVLLTAVGGSLNDIFQNISTVLDGAAGS